MLVIEIDNLSLETIEYSSDSDSSSCDEYIRQPFPSHERFQRSSYLSDFTDDEDAIHINVMRDFARLENAKMNLETDEFSASACQKIHSELLASVNQIYKNLKTKPLMRRSSHSTSSLSGNSKQSISKLSKSKSIEHKQNPFSTFPRKKPRAESIGPDNKLPKHLRRRIEKNNEEEKKKQKNVINENAKNNYVTEKMALLKLMKPKKGKSKKISSDIEG